MVENDELQVVLERRWRGNGGRGCAKREKIVELWF